MKIIIEVFAVIIFASASLSCSQQPNLDLTGKWQSLNGLTGIEFSPDTTIDFYKENKPFWSPASISGKLNYSIEPLKNGWYQFVVKDGKTEFTHGKIEVVKTDRIRMYIFKHHEILDVADEYQKANDFLSFALIMDKILKEPDPHLKK